MIKARWRVFIYDWAKKGRDLKNQNGVSGGDSPFGLKGQRDASACLLSQSMGSEGDHRARARDSLGFHAYLADWLLIISQSSCRKLSTNHISAIPDNVAMNLSVRRSSVCFTILLWYIR